MSSQFSSIDPALEFDHNGFESLLQRNAIDATHGMVQLWDESNGTFWRSTVQRCSEGNVHKAFFPTVSLRCIDALVSLIVEFPDWIPLAIRDSVLGEMVPNIISHGHNELNTSLNVEDDGSQQLNLFTLSLYIQAFSRISGLQVLSDVQATKALAKLEAAVASLLSHAAFSASDGDEQLRIHPFLLYHSSRAVSSFMLLQRSKQLNVRCGQLFDKIKASVRASIERLIARNKLASLNPSECVASAFCAATLGLV